MAIYLSVSERIRIEQFFRAANGALFFGRGFDVADRRVGPIEPGRAGIPRTASAQFPGSPGALTPFPLLTTNFRITEYLYIRLIGRDPVPRRRTLRVWGSRWRREDSASRWKRTTPPKHPVPGTTTAISTVPGTTAEEAGTSPNTTSPIHYRRTSPVAPRLCPRQRPSTPPPHPSPPTRHQETGGRLYLFSGLSRQGTNNIDYLIIFNIYIRY